jgi:RNase P/RNase MRP subunit p30
MTFVDIVFPEGNEEEFVKIAEKLGYSGLCFIYEKPTVLKKIDTKLKLYSGLLCKTKLVKSDLTIIESQNRNILTKRPNLIINIEGSKDFIHQRDSGLDQVICKDMQKFNVAYAIPFSSILNSGEKEKLLGRVLQNIELCLKYKVDIVLASFASLPTEMRNPKDLLSFALTLGMQPSDANKAVENADALIQNNLHPKKMVEKLD